MKITCRRESIRFVLVAAFLAVVVAPANAGCRYFRVSSKVEQCKEEKASDFKELSRPDNDIPELPPTDEGKLMHVRCSCDYAYSGSNPLCDSSQTQEFDSAMGTDNNANPCAGAKAFCDHLCPSNLD